MKDESRAEGGAMPRTPRCPKCRTAPVRYTEVWSNHGIVFGTLPDGTPEESGILTEGAPCGVIARCASGHSWKLRGVWQITELR